MAQPPSPAWDLPCDYCDYKITVFARGARGSDPGAGVEAAMAMRAHVARCHPAPTANEETER